MNETLKEAIVKKVRAKRHSVRQKLDAIGIVGLCAMVNKSSIKEVANELGIIEFTLYKYLETHGARRKIQYVLEDKKGLKK